MDPLEITSFSDLRPYPIADELLFGKLRSTSDYLIREIIYIGPNQTRVCSAQDKTANNRPVAIKETVVAKSKLELRIHHETFNEIHLLKSLEHENIIKLYDVAIDPDLGRICAVLEYGNITLSKLMTRLYPDQKSVPFNELKAIIQQIFKGLKYLHKNYIIHGDLKPSNLMISSGGSLKIIDFGLAQRYSLTRKANAPEIMTLWYRAPEILFGAPDYCAAVDLWAAGCVLAELLKKKILFEGHSEISQINLIMNLLGTPNPQSWPGLVKCKALSTIKLREQKFNRLREHFKDSVTSDVVNIIYELLVYDPHKRSSAEVILENDWFERAPFPSEMISIKPRMTN